MFRPEGHNPSLCREILRVWETEGVDPILSNAPIRAVVADHLKPIHLDADILPFVKSHDVYSAHKTKIERITRWLEWLDASPAYVAADAYLRDHDSLFKHLGCWLLASASPSQRSEFNRYVEKGLPAAVEVLAEGVQVDVPSPPLDATIPTVCAQVFAIWCLSAFGYNKVPTQRSLLEFFTHGKSASKWECAPREIRKSHKQIRDSLTKLGLI
jgi:hypothetical protein